ncbi:MAG: DNA adenine methylase [Elusimicrobiota bacterium]|jgi:adenine-specific DNA-methyltransferase|nr:DNA adenine methylase [Elusimicrobiota bacterium]
MLDKQEIDIFGKKKLTVPKTEGIKYAGSKLKIIPYIVNILSELDGIDTVLDGFSGTTRVSQALAQIGYKVSSNDVSAWSEVFANCYLKADNSEKFYQEILNHLNNLKGYEGWFTQNYGGTQKEACKPFQIKNTKKLDAIRDEIDKINIGWVDKCVILTSLIYALDSVDSTLGHYAAYLSHWSQRSYKDMVLKLPRKFKNTRRHKISRADIFDILKEDNEYDLIYFDPPYGSNNEKMPPSRVRYGAYYHIWTTVIKNDKPKTFGKVGRREDSRDLIIGSVFEEFRKDEDGYYIAMKSIRKMIEEAKARYILLSYSSGGRATKEELNDIISKTGKLSKIIEIDYKKNVMANMRWTYEWANADNKNKEYLFLIEKN